MDSLLKRPLRPPVTLRPRRYGRIEGENDIPVELYADITASPALLDDCELIISERKHHGSVERLALTCHHWALG